MTLPKAPPLRRYHLPPPAPRRAGGTTRRLQSLVRRHEEDEKPFDPERAPRWRGSSSDFVANGRRFVQNPKGFHAALEQLVAEYYGKLKNPDDLSEDQMLQALVTAFEEESTRDALERADELLEGFGVEHVGGVDMHDGPRYLYINFGDTYAPTIAWSRDDNKVFVAMGGWGDLAKENEESAFDEGWMNWLASEFSHALEMACIAVDPDHDDDTPVPGGAQEKALALIESAGSEDKELFQRALHRAQNAAGGRGKTPEVTEESDGSIFVTHLDAVAREAAAMLAEGWEPGKWEGHSKLTPNTTQRPWEAYADDGTFLGDSADREGARALRRAYLRKKYGVEPDLEYVDQSVVDRRLEDDENYVGNSSDAGVVLLRALERFVQATVELNSAWLRADADERELGGAVDIYPFEQSFDELTPRVIEWAHEGVRELGGNPTRRAPVRLPLSAALVAYARAASALSEAWEHAPRVGEPLNALYPFRQSFDEVAVAINEWVSAELGFEPNARDNLTGREYDPATQDAFIRALDKGLGAARERQVRYRSGQGTLYVNFYNLPAGVGSAGGGAEAENNRLMVAVREQPGGNVRAELVNSVFPREYRLRAKAGPVEKIAAYVADYLNKIAREIPPNFTHTRR